MKLYTEEQMLKVWRAGQKYWETSGASITFEELLEHEKPIELPSDEDIKKESEWLDNPLERLNFQEGIKWMRDKIQGGNNE